ncbi:acyltransferase family protein [Streptomyces flavofungini]|uniref:acyltransferase family protein n=1 Tax=Streptomyces flavofungini TaxID=68200 RepID=UPI0025AF0DD7|nr:hypothetical protein [Streptomyces flavofungini]WJV48994.1 hypothetical protein QUY26_27855 [Streptomyces flavofungini]
MRSEPAGQALPLVLVGAAREPDAAESSPWRGAPRARWVTGVGLISYSLYVWHEPVMLELDRWGLLPRGPLGFAAGTLTALAVAVAGTVSYWLVEYPAGLLGRARDARGAPREFSPERGRAGRG